jgi:peroxiredoxin Q/BCP
MKAYRDKYAEIKAKGAQVVAISSDDLATLKRFKAEVQAPFPFLSDPGGVVAAQYSALAKAGASRTTVSVDRDGTVAHISQGLGAIFPSDDIKACPAHKGAPEAEPTSI